MLPLRKLPLLIALVLLSSATLATLTSAQPGGKGGQLPETVKLEAGIQYAGTMAKSQRLNLLLPTKPKGEKPLPAIIYIQGSAWMASNPGGGQAYLAKYVGDGEYIGAGVGHR